MCLITNNKIQVVLVLLIANLLASCSSIRSATTRTFHRKARQIKPIVAVTDFENRAGFQGKWELGNGMADLLTSALLETKRFTVLEHRNRNNVIDEIMRQGKDLFRTEGQVRKGRLKNARYLIRGAVTDFTVTGDASGWFDASSVRAGRGKHTRVALNISILDIETGEIISSVNAEGGASAGGVHANIDYKKVSFGGDTYFRTPLGHATQKAMRKALKQIVRDIQPKQWKPLVAGTSPDYVIINGGQNMRIRNGDVFTVRKQGREITDPDTGNVIETIPGPITGKIAVYEVLPKSAHALILKGDARRGYLLERGSK